MANRSVFPRRKCFAFALVMALFWAVAGAAQAPSTAPVYRKPPQEILDVLNAPATPLASVNPSRTVVLLYTPVRYPSIADLAQPMLRLAGLRLNPNSHGRHNPPRFVGYVLKRFADGKEIQVSLPPDPYLSRPFWAPDGAHFAFTQTTRTAIELWIGNTRTGATRRVQGVVLNAVLGDPCQWMPDSRFLLCRTVARQNAKPPTEPREPSGPRIQESFGRATPAPTYEDLLENDHDKDLFDFYATAQLVRIDSATGKAVAVGGPAIFADADPSPDGRHILVSRIHRPYSYLLPVFDFPREVEVWDVTGRAQYKVASLPLQDTVPMGGVPTGPRSIRWRANASATLVWVEALDGGNPREKVPHRDRVMWISAPFSGKPAELARTESRFAGLLWGERKEFALLRDFDRESLRSRTWFLNPEAAGEAPRLVWDLNSQDRYHDPGRPALWTLPSGQEAIHQNGDFIYLEGRGASREGDRPFLDRLDVKTLKTERLWRCDESIYESLVELLAPDGSKFLTERESAVDPPNYFLRTRGTAAGEAFTRFPDPTPQLKGIRKQLVRYQRPDGVGLSMTLYLPPDYKPGQRRPAVMWAYPLEYNDPSVAGQVSGSPHRFTSFRGPSQLFFLLAGYVVMDGAAMPVVGDPETVNNTYLQQIVADAKAAIDKVAEMGFVDPNRVGVGGHSYGAFMTANLLAHSDLFRAGIARSGAYNRTLTPFGFQRERRTLWQAPEVYLKVSPFLYADKIKAPLLLIHGEADNNSGTFPIQSDRMYRAIKGNGGSVRYVTLPLEAHGYAARESVEDVLWEMIRWFDTYVKNAPPSSAAGSNGAAARSPATQ